MVTSRNPQSGSPGETDIDYRKMVESVCGCAILMLDAAGNVSTWLPAAERITGYVARDIVGMSLSKMAVDVTGSESTFRRAMEVARISPHGATLQMLCKRKEGAEFWADILISAIAVTDGNACGYSIVLRDFTARKQAEELLEDRTRQLIEASRLKDEFLATVSHELRTPLNSILGWTQLFRGGKLDEAGRAHALETIEQSAKTQARLIEDLLDVSRIVTGKMRLEVRSVQIADVISAAVDTLRPAADAKNISIHQMFEPVGRPVFGDPNRLQQVMWNLLSNAIKFTPHGGFVHVILQRAESYVQILVKDNGVGIKPEFLPQVFDAFRQADSSSTRSHKGLGLGLTIVRRLIELHGGTVRAESDGEGSGTVVEIRLPVASPSKSSPVISTIDPDKKSTTDSNAPNSELTGLRVVAVDDDAQARELIAAVLAHNGIQAEVVSSVTEALSAIRRVQPAVLISDIEMPDADGYMLIQEVRALNLESGGRTPAIALTAYARAEDRSRCLAAGFQLHLSKPIEANELVTAIISLANQRRKGQGHAQTTCH
jgi:PAS domain S-box-containing protein